MSQEFVIPEAEPEVKIGHYKKHIHSSSTLHVKRVECDTYDIGAHSSSTFRIGELICRGKGDIGLSGASTLIISKINQVGGICKVDIEGASTMRLDDGTLKQAVGEVRGWSTGLCYSNCSEPSNVTVKSLSTWKGC